MWTSNRVNDAPDETGHPASRHEPLLPHRCSTRQPTTVRIDTSRRVVSGHKRFGRVTAGEASGTPARAPSRATADARRRGGRSGSTPHLHSEAASPASRGSSFVRPAGPAPAQPLRSSRRQPCAAPVCAHPPAEDPRTRAYRARRNTEGKSGAEIRRCLKPDPAAAGGDKMATEALHQVSALLARSRPREGRTSPRPGSGCASQRRRPEQPGQEPVFWPVGLHGNSQKRGSSAVALVGVLHCLASDFVRSLGLSNTQPGTACLSRLEAAADVHYGHAEQAQAATVAEREV